jgi:hypothetical protein
MVVVAVGLIVECVELWEVARSTEAHDKNK